MEGIFVWRRHMESGAKLSWPRVRWIMVINQLMTWKWDAVIGVDFTWGLINVKNEATKKIECHSHYSFYSIFILPRKNISSPSTLNMFKVGVKISITLTVLGWDLSNSSDNTSHSWLKWIVSQSLILKIFLGGVQFFEMPRYPTIPYITRILIISDVCICELRVAWRGFLCLCLSEVGL